ncbi:MAG: Gfo/Idh/MocA family oxidoreductase [Deltaproteobacteria bacterium]|nr:Gfo/Idh/MocA family oxidoreductase [Deltaproteobacteria bacterium]
MRRSRPTSGTTPEAASSTIRASCATSCSPACASRTDVRVGVVGAGGWGINHVRVLANERLCRELVVHDTDPRQRARVAEVAPAAQWVATFDEVVARCDAIVIATPAATHEELATRAIAAGKQTLIEKPLALSLEGARKLAALPTQPGQIVMIGHLMLFHPAVRRLHELVRSGTLGHPYYAQATRVNLGRLRADETALWCLGTHDLSMLDFLFGEPGVEVSACGKAVLQPGVEDVVFATVRYASGLMANLHVSWLHPRKERRFTLVCSRQMVEFDDVAREKLKIYDRGYDRPPDFKEFGEFLTIRDGDVHIPQIPMIEPLRAELQAFLHGAATGTQPETDLASALRVTAILDAAERSIRHGGTPQAVEST